MSEKEKKDDSREFRNQIDKVKEKFSRKPQAPRNKNPFSIYWVYVIILIVIVSMSLFRWTGSARLVEWAEFNSKMLQTHDVERIAIVNDETAEIYIKPDRLKEAKYDEVSHRAVGKGMNPGPHFIMRIEKQSFTQLLQDAQKDFAPEDKILPSSEKRDSWFEQYGLLIAIGVMFALWIFIMRRMSGGTGSQLFNIGKSRATLFDKDTHVNVTFNDVAGLEEAKIEVMEIVDFLKNPKKYTALGAKIPKGALLVGPPGTGKTLLAKAVAGEAKVPFFSLSGSDFVEMFVGVGASRVRDLFRQAKEKAPCIIFIDEIDAIGRARGKSPAHGANDERESTLNQLLTEMDGFGTNSGVILMAATNRADILDRALMRAGRFDRQIYVDLPDLKEREAIFKVHLKPLKLDQSVDIEFLAKQTPGFSGADIANICNEAALIAARKNKTSVEKQDFLDAVDRIIGGLEKKNKIISADEKKVIAYHEAGHATVSWFLEHASPLVKVTIVPRGRSLGAAWYLPEERQITTTDQLLDEVCAALGGRAAEDVIFGKISTGALSDLEKITKQVYAMVVYYGLNEKIGNISFWDSTGQSEFYFTKPYSEKTAQTIDEEVKAFIDKAYQRTKDILIKHKDQLTQLADHLLSKEVIFKEDLERIFGKRPYEKEPEIDKSKISMNGQQNGQEKKEEEKKEETQKDNPTLS